MDWVKALLDEEAKQTRERKALGQRSGLRGQKQRADPLRHLRVPDIPVTADIDKPPIWVGSIKETSLPATPPSDERAIQKQHQFDKPTQRLYKNAAQELEDLRRQLRKAYGLDPDEGGPL